MQPYLNEKTKTYVFFENGKLLDIEITFDLIINGNILARDINAQSIEAWDITARNVDACDIDAWNIKAKRLYASCDIKAWNIEATEIRFYAICHASKNIICESIEGRHLNSKYFVLDGNVIILRRKK